MKVTCPCPEWTADTNGPIESGVGYVRCTCGHHRGNHGMMFDQCYAPEAKS